MKITPASALAVWAILTAWLVVFYVLERFDAAIGDETVDMIQAASAALAACFYRSIRKMFAAWLDKNR